MKNLLTIIVIVDILIAAIFYSGYQFDKQKTLMQTDWIKTTAEVTSSEFVKNIESKDAGYFKINVKYVVDSKVYNKSELQGYSVEVGKVYDILVNPDDHNVYAYPSNINVDIELSPVLIIIFIIDIIIYITLARSLLGDKLKINLSTYKDIDLIYHSKLEYTLIEIMKIFSCRLKSSEYMSSEDDLFLSKSVERDIIKILGELGRNLDGDKKIISFEFNFQDSEVHCKFNLTKKREVYLKVTLPSSSDEDMRSSIDIYAPEFVLEEMIAYLYNLLPDTTPYKKVRAVHYLYAISELFDFDLAKVREKITVKDYTPKDYEFGENIYLEYTNYLRLIKLHLDVPKFSEVINRFKTLHTLVCSDDDNLTWNHTTKSAE